MSEHPFDPSECPSCGDEIARLNAMIEEARTWFASAHTLIDGIIVTHVARTGHNPYTAGPAPTWMRESDQPEKPR